MNVILTNAKGGFLNLGPACSKFQGFFVCDGEVFKVLEEIRSQSEILDVSNDVFMARRRRAGFTESFMLPKNFSSLVYESSAEKDFELVFDVRKAYDMDDKGRVYKLHSEKGRVVLEFLKYSEPFFVVVSGFKSFLPVGSWSESDYCFDRERNSPPFRWWVYSALKVRSRRVVVTAGKDRAEAVSENAVVLKELKKIKVNERNAVKKIAAKTDEAGLALNYSANALTNLVLDSGAVMAGLPWFFQLWTRDECVSLKALKLIGEGQLEKKIILQRIAMIGPDGRLPNRVPASRLGSADSVGWLFLRVYDVLELLDENEKKLVCAWLKSALELLIKNFHRDGFFVNSPFETWMDTESSGRGGARIEVQALAACMFGIAYRLTKEEIYLRLKESLVKNVRSRFMAGSFIKDGAADAEVRPNIFIAYYACPELFSADVWRSAFGSALSRLWLEWGGVSTIDKSSPGFHPGYTGEDNKSYHSGDSWYWLNNLAAVCMCRLDRKHFEKYISSIFASSVKDIMHLGALGCSSEVSSASVQTASGCLSQAWSSAMFIELCGELGLIARPKKSRKKVHKAEVKRRRSRSFRVVSVRKK